MLADPCDGPITRPIYGGSQSGYVAKFSSNFGITLDTSTDGYVLWSPDFCGDNSDAKATSRIPSNYVLFTPSGPTVRPVNTVADPLFSGDTGSATTGRSRADPAYEFVSGDLVQDFRCAAACLDIQYTGRTDEVAGEFAIIQGLPRDMFFAKTGSSLGAPNVNELFALSPSTTRTSLGKLEVKWRPSDFSSAFRTTGADGEHGTSSHGHDRCFNLGIPATSETESGGPVGGGAGAVTFMGFAWRGCGTTVGGVRIRATKVIEWRPNLSSGLILPKQISQSGDDEMDEAVSYLDKFRKAWDIAVKYGPSAYKAMKTSAAALGGVEFDIVIDLPKASRFEL